MKIRPISRPVGVVTLLLAGIFCGAIGEPVAWAITTTGVFIFDALKET